MDGGARGSAEKGSSLGVPGSENNFLSRSRSMFISSGAQRLFCSGAAGSTTSPLSAWRGAPLQPCAAIMDT